MIPYYSYLNFFLQSTDDPFTLCNHLFAKITFFFTLMLAFQTSELLPGIHLLIQDFYSVPYVRLNP